MEEQEKAVIDVDRRKRIENYKKVIVAAILAMIILPTLLCILLFIKVSSLQKQIDDLANNKNTQTSISDEEASSGEDEIGGSEADNMSVELSTNELIEKTTEQVSEDDSSAAGSEDVALEVETTTGNTEDDAELEPYSEWTDEQLKIIDRYKDQGVGKKIFLTFDDGPSIYTEEILDILDYYGVKATFFVNGREDEESLKRYKLIVERGHAIGLHSYSHQYDDIYSSVANFEKDLFKISDLVYEATGVKSMYYRFPGGSSNSKTELPIETFITYLNENGYKYFDWNSTCGDGASATVPMESIVTNVMDDAVKKNNCIALLHDARAKRTTVDGLPLLIETLINAGFEICPIDDDTPLIQQRSVE